MTTRLEKLLSENTPSRILREKRLSEDDVEGMVELDYGRRGRFIKLAENLERAWNAYAGGRSRQPHPNAPHPNEYMKDLMRDLKRSESDMEDIMDFFENNYDDSHPSDNRSKNSRRR